MFFSTHPIERRKKNMAVNAVRFSSLFLCQFCTAKWINEDDKKRTLHHNVPVRDAYVLIVDFLISRVVIVYDMSAMYAVYFLLLLLLLLSRCRWLNNVVVCDCVRAFKHKTLGGSNGNSLRAYAVRGVCVCICVIRIHGMPSIETKRPKQIHG